MPKTRTESISKEMWEGCAAIAAMDAMENQIGLRQYYECQQDGQPVFVRRDSLSKEQMQQLIRMYTAIARAAEGHAGLLQQDLTARPRGA